MGESDERNRGEEIERRRVVAHGKNAEQKGYPGKEYWKSRLHRGGEMPGRYTKQLTHRKERRINKQEILRGVNYG